MSDLISLGIWLFAAAAAINYLRKRNANKRTAAVCTENIKCAEEYEATMAKAE